MSAQSLEVDNEVEIDILSKPRVSALSESRKKGNVADLKSTGKTYSGLFKNNLFPLCTLGSMEYISVAFLLGG